MVAFAAVYLFFVRSLMGQSVDERAFAGADTWNRALINTTSEFLDFLPIVAVAVAIVLAIVIVMVRKNWWVFFVAIGAAAAANASTQILKYAVLSRPQTGVSFALANSLPSGHTAVAASAALVIFLISAPRIRAIVAVIGALLTMGTGTATLVNQWHRPSDVIAAVIVVAFWGCVAGVVLASSRGTSAPRPTTSRLRLAAWAAAVLALIGVIGFVVTYLATTAGVEHLFIAYVGGVAGIAAVSLAVAVLGNRLYRWLV